MPFVYITEKLCP